MQKKISGMFFLTILSSISLIVYSQKPPAKFGKVSLDELKSNTCPIDSTAHAYFIFDFGSSYFEYADTKVVSNSLKGSRKGFQLFFTRHCRIKILDNNAFSWANFEIPLYHDGDEEKITKIKACTYNLNGKKIEKTKLKRTDIYKEESSQNWFTEKFAMPAVREGSIIEIEYTIKSDFFFNLREWYFQKSIPVLQSEYHVSVPEYYNYNQTQKGYFPIKKEYDSRQAEITINYHQKAEGMSVKEQTYTKTYDYRENNLHFYAKKIPAFPIEEYLRTEENYLSQIEFEIHYTKFPNSVMNYYTTSWEKINENLLNDSRFGHELKQTSHIKKDVDFLKQSDQMGFSLLYNAFNFIKNKLTWNEYNSKYPTSSLSKAYKENGGNCADINLNLIILLRELGFETYPVLLSTQKHGIIHPSHPSISSFNYVIAMTKLGDDVLLMDATDPYSEINLLPIRCLNDKGRIVNNAGGEWVVLMDYKPYSSLEVYKLEVDKNLSINGSVEMVLKDYAAYLYKKEIKKYNNIDEYKNILEEETKDCKIHDIKVYGLDTARVDLKINRGFTQDNYIEHSKDIAFFKPAYHAFISKNPFKLEKRDYPVEYNYPFSVQQIYSISIPENYTINEIPESVKARTPDGSMNYTYNITQLGNKITLTIMLSTNKSLFLPNEYQTLKNFYQMIVDKQNELIILKPME